MSCIWGTRFLKSDDSTGSTFEAGIGRLATTNGMEEGLLRFSFRSSMDRSGAIRAPGLAPSVCYIKVFPYARHALC